MKKVSVIVPIYKGNCYIPNIIRMLEDNWVSVNKFEPIEIELILVNDFPSEKLAVKRQMAKNISLVEIVNKNNSGIHFSRIQGFLQSKGELILFLDQDDEISPVYLREQLCALKDYDMIICNGKHRNNLIYKNTAELNRALNENEYRNGYNRIASPGQVLLRRQAIPAEWLNNIITQNGADDYFLWMLMFCKKNKIAIQDKILYLHVISDDNTSKDLIGMDWSVIEVAEKMKSLGFLTPEEEISIRESRTSVNMQGFPDKTTNFEEQKYKRMVEALDIWMTLRERKLSVDRLLTKKCLNKIAIYGAGILGKHLYYELQGSDIQVECFIDQNSKAKVKEIKTVVLGAPIGQVDAIIVTPIIEYAQIRENLKKLYSCQILSITSVLFNVDYDLQTE